MSIFKGDDLMFLAGQNYDGPSPIGQESLGFDIPCPLLKGVAVLQRPLESLCER